MTALLWVLAVALIVIGIAGTILPALPGAILVFGGIVLAAWIDDFARIPVWLLVILAVLTALAWIVDYVAAAAGAKKAGASRHAIAGAMIGTVLGIFTGLWGLLFMPLLGAAIGEFIAQRTCVGPARWGSRPGSDCCWARRPRSRSCSRWSACSSSRCSSEARRRQGAAHDLPPRANPEEIAYLRLRVLRGLSSDAPRRPWRERSSSSRSHNRSAASGAQSRRFAG